MNQHRPAHHQGWIVSGWSELAPTNAPVADEPVEAVFWMDENPILPARFFFFFFHLFSTPKFSPVLPTTYLPPPTYHLPTPPSLTPSPELQRPRAAVERELELWLWSWSGWSWSGVAGVGAGPTRTRKGKKSSSFSCLLACLLVAACYCNAVSSGAWELATTTQQTLELAATKPCNAASSRAPLAVEEKEEPWTFCPILYIFYFALV
jgi:hypothetical protein